MPTCTTDSSRSAISAVRALSTVRADPQSTACELAYWSSPSTSIQASCYVPPIPSLVSPCWQQQPCCVQMVRSIPPSQDCRQSRALSLSAALLIHTGSVAAPACSLASRPLKLVRVLLLNEILSRDLPLQMREPAAGRALLLTPYM